MVVSLGILLRAGVFPDGLGAFRYMSKVKPFFGLFARLTFGWGAL